MVSGASPQGSSNAALEMTAQDKKTRGRVAGVGSLRPTPLLCVTPGYRVASGPCNGANRPGSSSELFKQVVGRAANRVSLFSLRWWVSKERGVGVVWGVVLRRASAGSQVTGVRGVGPWFADDPRECALVRAAVQAPLWWTRPGSPPTCWSKRLVLSFVQPRARTSISSGLSLSPALSLLVLLPRSQSQRGNRAPEWWDLRRMWAAGRQPGGQ